MVLDIMHDIILCHLTKVKKNIAHYIYYYEIKNLKNYIHFKEGIIF